MMAEFFDVQNGKVVINPNCLLIPEFKEVHDFYEDPIPAFCYLHYYFYPKSPYANLQEDQKEEILLNDFPGDYTTEDDVMIDAMDKMKKLYITPTYRYYLDNKILLEKIGRFARNTQITTGRDGNLSALTNQIKSVGKTIQEFKQLEKVVKEETDDMGGRVRGDKKLAYDQE